MMVLDQEAIKDKCRISAYGAKINLNALLLLRAQPMRPRSHVACHPRLFVRYCIGARCAISAPMRWVDLWAGSRAMACLVLCSLLLVLSACTGASPRPEHGLALSVQKVRPQRIGRPVARTAHAVPTVATTVTDADEKEKLFRDFLEWQGARDAAR